MKVKVYIIIGLFGGTIIPILDFFYNRSLVVDSNNLPFYIICHVLLLFPNAWLQMAVFAFFDNARVDWQRRYYLMELLTSTIQADNGSKFKTPELIIAPLFNFLDQRSLLSWLDVRSVFLTAGAKYQLRIEIYLGIFILVDIFIATVFSVKLLVNSETPMNDQLSALLFIYIVVITCFLLHTLFRGAFVNI